MTNVDNLPADTIRLIALNMMPKELLNFCLLKKRFNEQICKDKIFLKSYGLLHLTSDAKFLPKKMHANSDRVHFDIIRELMKLEFYLDNMKSRKLRRDRLISYQRQYLFTHHYDKFILNNWDLLKKQKYSGEDLANAVSFDMPNVAEKIKEETGTSLLGGRVSGVAILIETGDIKLLESMMRCDKKSKEDVIHDAKPEELENILRIEIADEPESSLMAGARSGNIDMMKYILDILKDKLRNNDCSDAIKTAAARGDKKMLQYLVEYKTNFEKIIPYNYYSCSDIIPESGFPELDMDTKEQLLINAAVFGSHNIIRQLDKEGKINDLQFLTHLVESGFNEEVKYYMEKYYNLLDSEIVLKIMRKNGSNDELLKYYFDNYLRNYEIPDEYSIAALIGSIKNLDVIKYIYKEKPEFFTVQAIQGSLNYFPYEFNIKKSKFLVDLGANFLLGNNLAYVSHELLLYVVEKSDQSVGKKKTDEFLRNTLGKSMEYINNSKNLEYLYRRGVWSKKELEKEIKYYKEELTRQKNIYKHHNYNYDSESDDKYDHTQSPYYKHLKERARVLKRLGLTK